MAADKLSNNKRDKTAGGKGYRDWDAPRAQPPANAPRGPRAPGAAPVRGVGGAGPRGGKGPREPRAKVAPKTNDDLDKELGEYMARPAEPLAAKGAGEAPAGEGGDVEMS